MTQILWGFLNQAQRFKLYLEKFCAASSEVSRAEVYQKHFTSSPSKRGEGGVLQRSSVIAGAKDP